MSKRSTKLKCPKCKKHTFDVEKLFFASVYDQIDIYCPKCGSEITFNKRETMTYSIAMAPEPDTRDCFADVEWVPVPVPPVTADKCWPVAYGVVTIPQFCNGSFVETQCECVKLNTGWVGLTSKGVEAGGAQS